MEVTRGNLREVLEELEHIIPAADFLAIDGEFTGLHSGQDVNAFDTPAQYYSKIRSSWMNFLLIQFGLCAFKYDKENDKYSHRAYNFYIFPRPQNRSSPDPRFLCQSSSIDFLSSQGFDFNKLFKEGIPYLTKPEEQKLRDHLEEKQKSRSSTNNSPGNEENAQLIPIPQEHVSTIEDVCSRIENFLASSEPEEMELDRCNAYVRKLIFQTVGQRFSNSEVVLESRAADNRNRVLVVTRAGSEEDRKKKEQQKREKELQDLEDAVGFTAVLHKISQSGKLVIGHNMLLDVCHVLHQCYYPLPDDYSEFKEMVTCVFPKLLDTKFMSSLPPFKDSLNSTVLEHLYKGLCEEPFKMCKANSEEEGCGYNSVNEKYHEAGYDAYITGLCFISMAKHLGSLQKPKLNTVHGSPSLLKPYSNKLFLQRVQDSPFINLSGEDPILPRDHVFFVSFPKEWKSYDLTQLFSPFGSVYIAWINDSSAYVALHQRDQASLVQKTLTQSDTYTVMTYKAHQQLQNGKSKCKCAHSSGKSLCSLCINMSIPKQTVPSSPTTNIRKRRSVEALKEEVEVQTTVPKRKRNRSFTDKANYSKRVIDPIPEEQEMDVVRDESLIKNEGTCCTGNKKNAVNTSNINSSKESSFTSNEPQVSSKNKKHFEESDSWE